VIVFTRSVARCTPPLRTPYNIHVWIWRTTWSSWTCLWDLFDRLRRMEIVTILRSYRMTPQAISTVDVVPKCIRDNHMNLLRSPERGMIPVIWSITSIHFFEISFRLTDTTQMMQRSLSFRSVKKTDIISSSPELNSTIFIPIFYKRLFYWNRSGKEEVDGLIFIKKWFDEKSENWILPISRWLIRHSISHNRCKLKQFIPPHFTSSSQLFRSLLIVPSWEGRWHVGESHLESQKCIPSDHFNRLIIHSIWTVNGRCNSRLKFKNTFCLCQETGNRISRMTE
jgi:hypothetical protein